MTTFDQREEAFERKYAHDEELTFKAHARRNLKLGLWAASRLGKDGAAAEAYAQGVVALEIEGGSSDAVARKLMEDFAAGGVTKSEHQIRRQMDEFLIEAQREIRTA